MTAVLLLVLAANAPLSFQDIDVVEQLGERVAPDLHFHEGDGSSFVLGHAFGTGKPVLMTLGYFHCPMLCNLQLAGLVRALRESGLVLGRDYVAVSASVDPNEAPAAATEWQHRYLQSLGSPDSKDWHFLIGDEKDIHVLASQVGFKYAYDSGSKLFAHPAAAFLLAPDGKITRYLYGLDFDAKDLRLALVEASGGRIGTSIDRVLLTCYRYDPATRRYGWYVKGFLRAGGLLVFGCLATMLGLLWRRERRRGTA